LYIFTDQDEKRSRKLSPDSKHERLFKSKIVIVVYGVIGHTLYLTGKTKQPSVVNLSWQHKTPLLGVIQAMR